MAKKQRPLQQGKNSNQLRIIGGDWRGRKLGFPSIEGLRPTPDRVRETLFNWLAPVIPGARCLDLFSGSGALGLEALSRGASHVDLVDCSGDVFRQLTSNLDVLACSKGKVWHDTAESWLQRRAQAASYEVVFLDPPFHQQLLNECIALLEQKALLASNAWVYIETAKTEGLPALPKHWRLHREKIAGQVCSRLFTVGNESV